MAVVIRRLVNYTVETPWRRVSVRTLTVNQILHLERSARQHFLTTVRFYRRARVPVKEYVHGYLNEAIIPKLHDAVNLKYPVNRFFPRGNSDERIQTESDIVYYSEWVKQYDERYPDSDEE